MYRWRSIACHSRCCRQTQVAVQPRRRPSTSQLCVRSSSDFVTAAPTTFSTTPDTRAVAVLAEEGVAYSLASVEYEKRDGESLSASFARQCGVTPNDVIKTMVFKAGAAPPFIVLMNGDRTVCAKKLAALVGVGVKQEALLIYMQHSIQEREWVIVNAGSRNLVARLQTRDLVRLLQPRVVDVARD